MRKKFKVINSDTGEAWKAKGKEMLVMNSQGIFFVYNGEQYYPSITELSHRVPKYDIIWKGDKNETN